MEKIYGFIAKDEDGKIHTCEIQAKNRDDAYFKAIEYCWNKDWKLKPGTLQEANVVKP